MPGYQSEKARAAHFSDWERAAFAGMSATGRPMDVTLFSPAKLNLFLAVTGRRADGFHDLVSVAAPLTVGDELRARRMAPGGRPRFTLECDEPGVPTDGSNLVLKAAAAFAAATGWPALGGVHFQLTKRIPAGAGLGGGSSNAVAALRALNQLAGGLVGAAQLATLAAGLGSDCPLFLADGPVVIRGRGERVERLPERAAERLRGREVLLFKPGFGIGTPWAYGRMVAGAATPEGAVRTYLPAAAAEARLAAWIAGEAPAEALLYNNLEPVACAKYLALPVLLAELRAQAGAVAGLSGSGSACFAFVAAEAAGARVADRVRAAWGPPAWLTRAAVG